MRTCIIHIGIHKTGTTAIQGALGADRTRLADAGITVPDAAGRSHVADHHGIGPALGFTGTGERRPYPLERLTADLAASRGDFAVISTEVLSQPGNHRQAVARIGAAVRAAGFEPKIVAFVRPQVPLINSHYLQHVHALVNGSSCAAYLRDRDHEAVLRFGRRLASWTETLDFVAVPYRPETFDGRILDRLLAAGGVPADRLASLALPPAERRNESPGRMAVAALRHLMRTRPDLAAEPLRRRTRGLALDRAAERDWMKEPFWGVDTEAAARIEAMVAEDNEAFARRHWGTGWAEAFPAAKPLPAVNEIDLDAIDRETRDTFDAFVADVAADLQAKGRRRRKPKPERRRGIGWRARIAGLFGR